MNSVKETLIAARKLIEKKENWTQHEYAQDAEGSMVNWDSSAAVKFCALGALKRVDGEFEIDAVNLLGTLAKENYGGLVIWEVNDFVETNPHEAVLQLYDAAIAKCE